MYNLAMQTNLLKNLLSSRRILNGNIHFVYEGKMKIFYWKKKSGYEVFGKKKIKKNGKRLEQNFKNKRLNLIYSELLN